MAWRPLVSGRRATNSPFLSNKNNFALLHHKFSYLHIKKFEKQ